MTNGNEDAKRHRGRAIKVACVLALGFLAACATAGREVTITAEPAHIMTASGATEDIARCMVGELSKRKVMMENIKVDVRTGDNGGIDAIVYFRGAPLVPGGDLGYFRVSPAADGSVISIWPMPGAKKAPEILEAGQSCAGQ